MKNINEIAEDFNRKYEEYWNENNFEKLYDLYSEDSILVGKDIIQSRETILTNLKNIYHSGWKKIKIETALTSPISESVIIVINRYEAFGVVNGEEKQIKTKSSHVLYKLGAQWVSLMHSAF
jgi:hypothetical protein